MSEMVSLDVKSLESILEKNLPAKELNKVWKILYGENHPQSLCKQPPPLKVKEAADANGFEFLSHSFTSATATEQLRPQHEIKVGLFQLSHPLPTWATVQEQINASHKLADEAINAAALAGVNIFCFPETWNMPFAFCTRSKSPWIEFAQNAENGPSTNLLQDLARRHDMVIISPIMERDQYDIFWNTAVIIDSNGEVLGKTRKNHIPFVEDVNESMYYKESTLGHPVFNTKYGKIGVNICYGRHIPLNWYAFGLNGAEIVFNPCAVSGQNPEPIWQIEARNAAIANSYYACAVNRVGTEFFQDLTVIDGKVVPMSTGHFFGSSYVAAPNGARSPGLSRTQPGLLVVELDLNLCRQVKDKWNFQMNSRLPLYAHLFKRASDFGYEQQIVKAKINQSEVTQ